MFKFEEREDGLFAEHENGRGFASVVTQTIDFDDDKGNLKVPKRIIKPLPAPLIHFTSYRSTLDEVAAFLTELKAALAK